MFVFHLNLCPRELSKAINQQSNGTHQLEDGSIRKCISSAFELLLSEEKIGDLGAVNTADLHFT